MVAPPSGAIIVDGGLDDDDVDASVIGRLALARDTRRCTRSGVTVRSLATAPWGARFASARSGCGCFQVCCSLPEI